MIARSQDHGACACLVGMGKWITGAALILSMAMASGQIASQSSLGLNTGLVIDAPQGESLAASSELHRVEGAPAELTDFMVSFVLEAKQLPATITLRLADPPLTFAVDPTTGVKATLGTAEWLTKPATSPEGRAMSVTLSVKRDPRQSLASLSLDGIEGMAISVPPGKLNLKASMTREVSAGAVGLISHLRLYNRALGVADIRELALLAGPARGKLSAFASTLAFNDNEVIAVLGGSEAVALMEEGTLEASLLSRFPAQRITLRNLAWESDTVWQQDRPMNFGDLTQQLHRSGATAVMLMLGRQECLEKGEAGLPSFRAALEKMVTDCARTTPRLWLVAPPLFGKAAAPLPDLSAHNNVLKQYASAIREIATAHRALFTDTTSVEVQTRDGLNLTEADLARVATLIGGTAPEAQGLLATVRAKSKLWHRYWRPSNWAFLYGDRTAQPSSRDHLNPNVRWFPQELEQYRTLITAKENELWKMSQELGRKLP